MSNLTYLSSAVPLFTHNPFNLTPSAHIGHPSFQGTPFAPAHGCQAQTQINKISSINVHFPNSTFVKQEPVFVQPCVSAPVTPFEVNSSRQHFGSELVVNFKTHSGQSFEAADIFERGNLDYVFNLLRIIQEMLDSLFPSVRADVIGDYNYTLQEKGIFTDNASSYGAIKRARNQLSHNDCASLHGRENVRILLEKAIAFIHELEIKLRVNLPQLQTVVALQQAFLQHKFTQAQYQVKQLKTKEDLGRVFLHMTGICLGNCAGVRSAVALTKKRDRDALAGVDTYYWLKWGSMGFLVRKTDGGSLDSRFVQHCAFLMKQRMYLYHPIEKVQNCCLDLWRIFESLQFIAVALRDFITLENINHYFPLLQKLANL